jgi:hypothetical protein
VTGSREMQEYYLVSCNQRLNKHFFDISASEHKKLLWLLASTVSPGLGNQYHQWIAAKKKTSDNKSIKFLREQYPLLKESELKLLSEINTKDELKKYARDLGWDDRRIKADL